MATGPRVMFLVITFKPCDFNEILYAHYVTRGHLTFELSNFL